MDSSDLATQDICVSPPTHRSSSLYSSPTSYQATRAPGQSLTQAVNENTPIVNSSQGRHYNSTENLRHQNGGLGLNGNGPTRAKTQGLIQQHKETDLKPHPSWYNRMVDRYGSLELENKGSVARDHLALERTFLAWLRTSLAFASIGIAVTQLFRLSNTSPERTDGASIYSPFLPYSDSPILNRVDTSGRLHSMDASKHLRSIGKPLGTTFIGVAIIILLVGFHRYFESQYWIVRGKFPASRGSVALIAFVAGALIVAALAVILAISPEAIES